MAEDEQAREPSSDGQGLVAGSAEASVRSRLPPCGDPRFGTRSPGPGAEEDSEYWGCNIPCQGGAITPRPRSRGSRAHGARGQKLGCAPHGLWPEPEGLAAGLSWRLREASSCSNHRSQFEPSSWEKILVKDQLKRLNKTLLKVQHITSWAHLLCNTATQIPDLRRP